MGFFSFLLPNKTSIPNKYSIRPTKWVVMIDDKNNRYLEKNYEGYGVFGGKDFYELLAEMNGYPKKASLDEKRRFGIHLFYDDSKTCKAPRFFEIPKRGPSTIGGDYFAEFLKDWVYEHLPDTEPCPEQGYFYEAKTENCKHCGWEHSYHVCPNLERMI